MPLGDVECAAEVPLGGVEWHKIMPYLRVCDFSRHTVTSSARS